MPKKQRKMKKVKMRMMSEIFLRVILVAVLHIVDKRLSLVAVDKIDRSSTYDGLTCLLIALCALIFVRRGHKRFCSFFPGSAIFKRLNLMTLENSSR